MPTTPTHPTVVSGTRTPVPVLCCTATLGKRSGRQLARLVERLVGAHRSIALDLSRLTRFNRWGIACLVALHERLRFARRQLCIVGVSEGLRRLLTRRGLTFLLPVER